MMYPEDDDVLYIVLFMTGLLVTALVLPIAWGYLTTSLGLVHAIIFLGTITYLLSCR